MEAATAKDEEKKENADDEDMADSKTSAASTDAGIEPSSAQNKSIGPPQADKQSTAMSSPPLQGSKAMATASLGTLVTVAKANTRFKARSRRNRTITMQLKQGKETWHIKTRAKIAIGRAALSASNRIRDGAAAVVLRVMTWLSFVMGIVGCYFILRPKSPVFGGQSPSDDEQACHDTITFFSAALRVWMLTFLVMATTGLVQLWVN
eukprot:SAG31_NODE_15019_length_775_cov_0.986686_1_plen_206_part_01